MRLFPGQYVLISVLLLSFAVRGEAPVKRETNDTSASKPPGSGGPQTSSLQKLLQGLIDFLKQIPLVGGALTEVVEKLVELILAIELLTNGAVARLLGGALPCEVSLDLGFQCSGITQNGGITELLINVIDNLPDLLVPKFIKGALKFVIKGLVAPLVDVLMGGQPDITTTK